MENTMTLEEYMSKSANIKKWIYARIEKKAQTTWDFTEKAELEDLHKALDNMDEKEFSAIIKSLYELGMPQKWFINCLAVFNIDETSRSVYALAAENIGTNPTRIIFALDKYISGINYRILYGVPEIDMSKGKNTSFSRVCMGLDDGNMKTGMRVFNAIARAHTVEPGIRNLTVEQFTKLYTVKKLLKIRGLGVKGIALLRVELDKLGLKLREE